MERLNSSVLDSFPEVDLEKIDWLLAEESQKSKRKIVVLDDDPTGVQTVHDVSVYTDWTLENIRKGFAEENALFFILTNSRGFTAEQTTKAHREIGQRVDQVSKETGIDYLIISRGDSTLRGHYPLETQLLREEAEKANSWKMDGEILCPYFKEGGRFTIGDVHYVRYGEKLVPAGETEFAKDKTFGYTSSDLKEYIEEKTKGLYRAGDVVSISLEEIRAVDLDGITEKLLSVKNFGKVIVNAIDNEDVKIFSIALYRALEKGKHFTYRTAAAFVKAFGNISDKPLLTRDEMVTSQSQNGGIIVIGSHTKKTTAQFEEMSKIPGLVTMEMNSDLVLKEGALEEEAKRISETCGRLITEGKTVAVYTKRKLLTVENDTKEEALIRSVKISDAVQSVVGMLPATPAFVVAKGGITSSDVGTKALKVQKARVLGQIRPGIPVWQTGEESRFPGTPYVIFPGNVGEVTTLREAVEILMGMKK